MSENSGEMPPPAVEATPAAPVEAPVETTPSDELGPDVINFAEAVGKLREKGNEMGDDHFQSIQEAANLEIPEPAAQSTEDDGAVPFVDPEDPDAEPFAYVNQTEQPATEPAQESEEPAAEATDDSGETEEPDDESTESEEPVEEAEEDESEEDTEEDETTEDDESEKGEGLTEAEILKIGEKLAKLYLERNDLLQAIARIDILPEPTEEQKQDKDKYKFREREVSREIDALESKLRNEGAKKPSKALMIALVLAGSAAVIVSQAMRAEAA